MNPTPIWFGPADRPLFGWLHLPEEANAGVVLCRPIGLEALSAYRAYRCLAEKLAAHGVMTLQFDYTGTGDSAGDPDDLVGVDTWLSDIGSAVDFVRNTGVSRIGLIGLRLGATLAAGAAGDNDVKALVLWDPCETGRGFLREQRMLAVAISNDQQGDPVSVNGLEIPGLLLPEDLAEAIRVLRLEDSVGQSAPRLLLLTRPERPSSAGIRERLSAENIEHGDAIGQAQFIAVEPGYSVMPAQVIKDIAFWTSRALDGPIVRTEVRSQPGASPTAIVARSNFGQNIIERTVRIGAEHLFGIVTELQDAEPVPVPTVLFMNSGRGPHTGPGRLWVEMARSWAAQGVRVLRVDLAGLGDSPTRPGRKPDVVYPAEAIEDMVDAARFIAPQDPTSVVLTGLCSGAYHALEGALLLNSRRVWLINPGLPIVPPELTERGAVDSRRQAVRPLSSLIRRLRENDQIVHLSVAITPALAWWVFDKLQLYPSSTRPLETLTRRGTELLVICSEPEFSQYAKRSRWAMRRLERSGRCHFELVKSMDHSLFNFAGRSEIMRLFTAQILEKVVPEFRPPEARVRKEDSSTG